MIFPAQRILVPDDLTPPSIHAWSWAHRLAARGARLESLFVYQMPPTPPLEGGLVPLPSEELKTQILARMRRRRPDAARWRFESGDAILGIKRREPREDLVILGTHGRTGWSRAFFGSVTESVMRDARVPVLAVRGAPKAVRTVLAPLNLQPYAAKGLLLAADAAAFLGARLVLLHVAPPNGSEGNPRLIIDGMVERLPETLREKTKPTLLLREGDPVPAILAEARRHDLVALTAHRKPLLRDWVIGTTVERVVRHSPVPVLAAPSA